MKKIFIGFFMVIFIFVCFGVASAEDAKYVGVKKCKMCHAKKYKTWLETGLATSFDSLKKGVKVKAKKDVGVEDKDYTADPECLACHSTGYGKGGFTSIEETPDLAGVTCEACHGPGGTFRKIMKKEREALVAAGMVVPEEQVCLVCHAGDSPFVKEKPFNYEERKEKTHDHSTKK